MCIPGLSRIRWFAVGLIAMTVGASDGFAQTTFYEATQAELRGKPGTLIRAEPFPGAPAGASAHRVLYRSVGLKGEPIAVSGVVVVPAGPVPAGGRAIVAWAHPTTGVARRCAPSLYPQALTWIHGLGDMLARGYVVTATDYAGQGTAGVHPYLIGPSEGRAVLDSVRAARALPGANTGSRFAVWGHSQGGHAALFAGQMARSYAPDLRLTGVAAAAPATDLAELFQADVGRPAGKILGAFALWSWSKIYGLSLDNTIEPTALPVLERVATFCNERRSDVLKLAFVEQAFEREGFLTVDITEVDPWRKLMRENTPGRAPAGAPVFIAQGNADRTVRPAVTAKYMQDLCRGGTPVHWLSIPGGDHQAAARRGAGAAVLWMAGRFAGDPTPNDC